MTGNPASTRRVLPRIRTAATLLCLPLAIGMASPSPQPAHPDTTRAGAAPSPAFPNIKLGALIQFQISAIQEKSSFAQDANPAYTRHWSRQIALRRMRVLIAGAVSPQTSFFFDSDSPLLGEVTSSKAVKLSMFVQDAYIQHVFTPEIQIVAGFVLVGIARNGLQGATSLMPVNYGSYSFLASTPEDNFTGRDLGISARGFLLDERLEYRAGLFSGRNFNQYSPLRSTFRVAYNFLDREKSFFYSGTTLGKSRLCAIGGGLDLQGPYRGYAADAFVDVPLSEAGSLTAQASFSHYNGGSGDSNYYTTAVPRQNVFFLEAGYYFREIGLQPVVKFETQNVSAESGKQVGASSPLAVEYENRLRSGSRIGAGLNYWLTGHNFSFKLMVERVYRSRAVNPAALTTERASSMEVVFQMQYLSF